MILIFASIILAIWGILDGIFRKVPVILLWAPAVIILVLNPLTWLWAFLPVFVALWTLKWILDHKTKLTLGLADVFAVPFLIFSLVQSPFWIQVYTPVILTVLILVQRKNPELRLCFVIALTWVCSWVLYGGILLL